MNDDRFIVGDYGRVHTLRFGHGAELLIALHGFAGRASIFEALGSSFTDQFTIIAFDLPFHGQTEWRKDSFSQSDIQDILAQILEKEGKSRFCLLGFSFGARLVQALLPEVAAKIDQLYLLAPDGIKTRGLGVAAQTPLWVRRLLARILQQPAWFLNLVALAEKIGLIKTFYAAFLKKNLSNPAQVQRLFGCWRSMDDFSFRKETLRQLIKESAFNTQVIVGEMDPFLDLNALQRCYENLKNVRIVVLERVGHQLVGQAVAVSMEGSKQSL